MRKIKSRMSILASATIALTLCLSLMSPAHQAEADPLHEEECFPAVLMLRGSGEGDTEGQYVNNDTGKTLISTNGYEGERIERLLEVFVNQTDPAKTISKVRFIGIDYPAAPVIPEEDYAAHAFYFTESFRIGAQNVVNFIEEDKSRGCKTRYMIVGYSQGVISARLASNLLGNQTDTIINSFVIGDPLQKSNGAKPPRQISAANTDPAGTGILRAILSSDAVFVNPLIKVAMQLYANELTQADTLVYKSAASSSQQPSRSLCHKGDLVCAPPGPTSFEEHTNYFDSETASGTKDIEFDVPAFDKQVQFLANSVSANPRARKLTKTPSIAGRITTYNIANARPDDICHWDEGSDGTVETVTTCGLHDIKHEALDVAKVSVKVVDSFGIEKTYTSGVSVIGSDLINPAHQLQKDQWLSLYSANYYKGNTHVYPTFCLRIGDGGLSPISLNNENELTMLSKSCWKTSVPTPNDALSAFKAVPKEDDNTKMRLVSGYDEDYSLEAQSDGTIMLAKSQDVDSQYFTPILISTIRTDRTTESYRYSFENDGKCLTVERASTSAPAGSATMGNCDFSNKAQQIIAGVNLNQEHYGKLSVERDTEPPEAVSDLMVEVGHEAVKLRWSEAKDNRKALLKYLIYHSSNGNSTLVDEAVSATGYSIDPTISSVGSQESYSIVAVDEANNKSQPVSISFIMPALIPKLPAPTFVSSSFNSAFTVIDIPMYDIGVASGVKVYRNSVHVATITDPAKLRYKNTPTFLMTTYHFTYRLILDNGLVSEESPALRTRIS